MSATAMTTEAFTPRQPAVRVRRSPLLLAGVAAAHGVLVLLLLRSALVASVPAPTVENPRSGLGGRLEVVLLDPMRSSAEASQPAAPIRFVAERVELPDLPPVELPLETPSNGERLAGLYLGQLRARIGRAWEGLHADPAPALPDCVVSLARNDQGEVLAVTLRDCRLDVPTRDRLLRAIRAASPLPAPPATLDARAEVELPLAVGRPQTQTR